jgi:hypothetical protein
VLLVVEQPASGALRINGWHIQAIGARLAMSTRHLTEPDFSKALTTPVLASGGVSSRCPRQGSPKPSPGWAVPHGDVQPDARFGAVSHALAAAIAVPANLASV